MRTSSLLNGWVVAAALVLAVAGCTDEPSLVTPTEVAIPITVSGTVIDHQGLPLSGVSVRVRTTVNEQGATVTTTEDGRFSFTEMALPTRPVTLDATKDAYFPRTLSAAPSLLPPVIEMQPHPHTDFSGEYVLTLIADGACSDLPTFTRTRTYHASITPVMTYPSFTIRLSEASFLYNSAVYLLAVPGSTHVSFYDDDDFNDVDGLVEQLNPGALDFHGQTVIAADAGNRHIDGPFEGHLGYCPGSPGGNAIKCSEGYVACDSKAHRLILTPR